MPSRPSPESCGTQARVVGHSSVKPAAGGLAKRVKVELAGTAKSASAVLPALQTSAQLQDVQFRGALTRESSGAEHFQMQIKLRATR